MQAAGVDPGVSKRRTSRVDRCALHLRYHSLAFEVVKHLLPGPELLAVKQGAADTRITARLRCMFPRQ